jgi:hypothetical protein
MPDSLRWGAFFFICILFPLVALVLAGPEGGVYQWMIWTSVGAVIVEIITQVQRYRRKRREKKNREYYYKQNPK